MSELKEMCFGYNAFIHNPVPAGQYCCILQRSIVDMFMFRNSVVPSPAGSFAEYCSKREPEQANNKVENCHYPICDELKQKIETFFVRARQCDNKTCKDCKEAKETNTNVISDEKNIHVNTIPGNPALDNVIIRVGDSSEKDKVVSFRLWSGELPKLGDGKYPTHHHIAIRPGGGIVVIAGSDNVAGFISQSRSGYRVGRSASVAATTASVAASTTSADTGAAPVAVDAASTTSAVTDVARLLAENAALIASAAKNAILLDCLQKRHAKLLAGDRS